LFIILPRVHMHRKYSNDFYKDDRIAYKKFHDNMSYIFKQRNINIFCTFEFLSEARQFLSVFVVKIFKDNKITKKKTIQQFYTEVFITKVKIP